MPTLVLTVGQGNLDKLEATLFAPLRKSIAKGKWDQVILLPSKETEPLAFQLAGGEPAIRIQTLPRTGDEDDADLCFSHFEAILSGLIRCGTRPAEITIDFTRGTKAMSAAVVLAAVTFNVPNLRYVTGKRERDGLVIAGKEEVRDLSSAIATTRRALGLAMHFLQRFQFTAVEALFPDERNRWLLKYPASCRADIEWTLWAARFWGAWDRFDYRAARSQLDSSPNSQSPALESWRCPKPQAKFLSRLAASGSNPGNAARDLAADLIANAGRRLASGAYEDALLRNYRALEMIGQARLFDLRLDSENLDRCNPQVQRWLAVEGRSSNRLDRGQACSLLHFLGDSFAPELDKAAKAGAWDRNRSILLHGFRAEADRVKARLTLDRVADVFTEENFKNRERLESAQFPVPGSES
jgi:CRISPR-associated protein (TIGR02710 family)